MTKKELLDLIAGMDSTIAEYRVKLEEAEKFMSKEQKDDLLSVFGAKWKNAGNLDYVACWYKKAVDFARKNDIVIISDLAYGPLVYDGYKPLSILNINSFI